jgi:imidazole glycerol-phosphate synthase subunit HisF
VLRARIIPCLLVHDHGLVKTTRFADPKYVGDPLNAVRIFNEKEVDELIVADIDASAKGREPDYELIEHLAAECRMPLAYAGGITNAGQVERIIALGVEKVAIGARLATHPQLITEAADRVGSQSLVAVVDVRRRQDGRYGIFTHNGTKDTGMEAAAFALEMQSRGAGELLVNSIDQDGVMKGYDLELTDQIRAAVSLPLTFLGGAGSHGDLSSLIARHGTIGAAAGSLFVFKGTLRAVLISYPGADIKREICAQPDAPEGMG